jgi:hypothetical protein
MGKSNLLLGCGVILADFVGLELGVRTYVANSVTDNHIEGWLERNGGEGEKQ